MGVFGLHGTRGLGIYLGILALIAVTLGAIAYVFRRGWLSTGPFSRLLMRVPGIGSGLRTVALARLTWSMAIASDSDLDTDKVVELAVRSTQNSFYTSRLEQMHQVIRRREPLHMAFRITRIYPDEFLDALETGETVGQISESMAALAKVLDDRAKNYCRLLAAAAGIGVLFLVFAILIFFIFQLVGNYLTPIYDTLNALRA
jgi:type II secretory pathway component PulF